MKKSLILSLIFFYLIQIPSITTAETNESNEINIADLIKTIIIQPEVNNDGPTNLISTSTDTENVIQDTDAENILQEILVETQNKLDEVKAAIATLRRQDEKRSSPHCRGMPVCYYQESKNKQTSSLTSKEDHPSVLHGDDRANTLSGGNLADKFIGGGGPDLIEGLNGNNIYYGGEENDILSGGFDLNIMDGGNGDDILDSPYGRKNILRGGLGHDKILFSTHADVFGGDGKDNISRSTSTIFKLGSIVDGGSGNDEIKNKIGSSYLFSSSTIYGGDGDDSLKISNMDIAYGEGGNDYFSDYVQYYSAQDLSKQNITLSFNNKVYGGEGDDLFISQNGFDILNGDKGNDVFVVYDSLLNPSQRHKRNVILHGGPGKDKFIRISKFKEASCKDFQKLIKDFKQGEDQIIIQYKLPNSKNILGKFCNISQFN